MTENVLLVPVAYEDRPSGDGQTCRRISFSNGLEIIEVVREADPGPAALSIASSVKAPDMDRNDRPMNAVLRTILTETAPSHSSLAIDSLPAQQDE